MDNGFASLIDAAAQVLVLVPVNPSFDTLAAGVSLYLSIMDRKPTTVSCPSPMMVGFNRIIGINKITPDLGNKNLTIKFKGYDAANIEKVSYDIVQGEFNLTVVPKTGFTAPGSEQLDMTYSGISADLVLLVGGVNDSDFPILNSDELGGAKIAHIGNRGLNTNREVLSLSRPASTVSELIATQIKENSLAMDPDIATNLIMGIEEGSSNFAGSEVTPDTFEIFAELLRHGGVRTSRVKLSPMGFPPGAIPTQPYTNQVSQVLQVPPTYANASAGGQVAQVSNTDQTQVINSDPMLPQVESKDGTNFENPPDDWLQPKVFKNSNPASTQPTTFSENKG